MSLSSHVAFVLFIGLLSERYPLISVFSATKTSGTLQASRTGAEGQHLTKVDRSEVIVPLKQVGMSVGKAISTARQEMDPKLTQKDLATKLNVKLSDITAYEAGTAAPDNKLMSRMEIMLNVHLRGPKLSKPLRVSDEEKAKAEKAKAEKGKTKQSGK